MNPISYESYVDVMTSVVTMITALYETNNNPPLFNDNNNNNSDFLCCIDNMDAPLQLIDHGSVLYLFLLQILLYYQQDIVKESIIGK